MKAVIGILLLVWVVVAPLLAGAESAGNLVHSGNELYAAGEYDKALEAYEKALSEQPDSGEILFNKGNAFFKKGDYDKAREAYQAAGLHTKDLSLEASAHYNLGNAIFAEGQKQLETDPQKALSHWGQSIQNYQEALRIDPQLKEAAQNIEVVRLTMKDLADRIKKAEEASREQQKQREDARKQLDEAIREQESEIKQNEALKQKAAQDPGESIAREAQKLASDQEKTREKTGEVAEKLKDLRAQQQQGQQPQQQPETSEGAVEESLEKAQEAQRSASEKLEKNQLGEARKDQEEALTHLQEALNESMSSGSDKGQSPNQKTGGQNAGEKPGDKEQQKAAPQDHSGEEKENGATKSAQQQQAGDDEPQAGKKEQGEKGDDQKAGAVFSESPDNILREEKENRLQLHRATQGGIKPVDKDW
jgi:Ca-activated chloride channel homolog